MSWSFGSKCINISKVFVFISYNQLFLWNVSSKSSQVTSSLKPWSITKTLCREQEGWIDGVKIQVPLHHPTSLLTSTIQRCLYLEFQLLYPTSSLLLPVTSLPVQDYPHSTLYVCTIPPKLICFRSMLSWLCKLVWGIKTDSILTIQLKQNTF